MQLFGNPMQQNFGRGCLRSLFSGWVRGLVLLSLTCVSNMGFSEASQTFLLDRYAPTAVELSGWPDDGLLLAEFGQEAEFEDREASTVDKKIRYSLELECATKTFIECRAFINANRKAILHALPDNPRYWALFWQVAKIPNLVDFSLNPSQQLDDYARLINASYWWFFRDLAHSGNVDIEHALAMQQAARNWSTGHGTLLARTIGLAVQGIVFNQMSFAMAQMSNKHNKDQLKKLIRLLKPHKLTELSLGPVFWVEQEWQLRSMRDELSSSPSSEIDIDAARIETFGLVDESELRLMIDDPERFHKSGWNVIAEHYLPISTMPWDGYWQEGVPPPDQERFDKLSQAAVVAPAYGGYIVSERIVHFHLFLFSALGEIYAGKTSPGLPSLPAPDHWHWRWVNGAQPKLCLVADNIHPSTNPMGVESGVELCVEYYDAAALASVTS